MALKDCRVKDIACGESHCVAVDTDGQLFVWGSDERGQVGVAQRHIADIAKSDKAQQSHSSPGNHWSANAVHLPVCINPCGAWEPIQVEFTVVGCGAEFSMALDREGRIWAWGSGEGGVLGLGLPGLQGRDMPTMIEALESSTSSINCGSYHAMALQESGELYGWGRAEGGQLGIAEARIAGHIEEKGLDDTFVCEPLPVHFNGDRRVHVAQVACGDVHSCALDSSGSVWSWGWGEFGQLGLGFSAATYELGMGGVGSKRLLPERLPAKSLEDMNIQSIACGGAFSAAIGEPGNASSQYTGNLFLWGANEVGQCALPPQKPSEVEVPTKVQALMHTVVRTVACGASHVVAVDTIGRAYSWGSAQYGQLGSSSPPKTFAPPPAWDPRDKRKTPTTQHQPMMIQSVSRIHIMKAACGLHHSLLVSEVSADSARTSNRDESTGYGGGDRSPPTTEASHARRHSSDRAKTRGVES